MMFNCMKVATLVLLVGCLVSVPAPAQNADKNCVSLRLLLQADLDFSRPIPYISWSGIVRGFLSDNDPNTMPIVLNGSLHGAEPRAGGKERETPLLGQSGHEEELSFVFDFGENVGQFVTERNKGIYTLSPEVSPHPTYPPMFADSNHYAYTSKIAPSGASDLFPATGWFEHATGYISLSGQFLVNGPNLTELKNMGTIWSGVHPNSIGIWNAEINGKICNATLPAFQPYPK